MNHGQRIHTRLLMTTAGATAAKAAGINVAHLPFNGSMPDPAVVDRFIKTITEPGRRLYGITSCAGPRQKNPPGLLSGLGGVLRLT